jgi:hypothetical protein
MAFSPVNRTPQKASTPSLDGVYSPLSAHFEDHHGVVACGRNASTQLFQGKQSTPRYRDQSREEDHPYMLARCSRPNKSLVAVSARNTHLLSASTLLPSTCSNVMGTHPKQNRFDALAKESHWRQIVRCEERRLASLQPFPRRRSIFAASRKILVLAPKTQQKETS